MWPDFFTTHHQLHSAHLHSTTTNGLLCLVPPALLFRLTLSPLQGTMPLLGASCSTLSSASPERYCFIPLRVTMNLNYRRLLRSTSIPSSHVISRRGRDDLDGGFTRVVIDDEPQMGRPVDPFLRRSDLTFQILGADPAGNKRTSPCWKQCERPNSRAALLSFSSIRGRGSTSGRLGSR